MKIISVFSMLLLGSTLLTSAAYPHPHADDEEAEFEEAAKRLQAAGKPCIKVLSIQRAGADMVVVCQQTAGRASSHVTHTLKN
jgi:hypothetical protein